MKIYNKLVRDRIPEIITAQGKHCRCKVLTEEEYLSALNAKLDEELAEYHESGSLEELADLLEVICALSVAKGSSPAELEKVRIEKALKRGGFDKKIMLIEVQEN